MTLPIETGIPMPPRGPLAEEKVPELALLKVGESIFIPNRETGGNPKLMAVEVALYGIRVHRRFEQHYEDEGLRVSRVR